MAAMLAVSLVVVGCGDDDTPAASPEPTMPDSPPTIAVDPAEGPLRLVAIGDSIPYNSSVDCPGCTGFVDRYAEALGAATGRRVEVANLSMHNGLTLPMLTDGLADLEDAIIVGVAHNSILLATDDPCGTTWDASANSFVDWTLIDTECSEASVAEHRPIYD